MSLPKFPKCKNHATLPNAGLNRFDKCGYEMISPLGHRSVFAARAANDPRDKEDVEHRAHEGGGHEEEDVTCLTEWFDLP